MGKTPGLLRSRAVAVLAVTTAVTGCQNSARGSSPTVSLNQEVRGGKFAFTITRVSMGTPNIGTHTAQGTFVHDLAYSPGAAVQVLGALR